jgi:putative addiction module killer protein
MEYQIQIYQTETGKLPYKIWLSSLNDVKAKSIIRLRLDRMSLGNFGHCKAIGDVVFELKIDFGPGYRIYFGKSVCSVCYCLQEETKAPNTAISKRLRSI